MAGSDNTDNSVVIVALPSDTDPVRKVSSEPEPHLTLMYLGDAQFTPEQTQHITDYVEYASTMLNKFYLDVTERGVLGDKNADVLFFSKTWSKQISRFRDNLLQDPIINAAHNAIEQFEGWTPHLTLGYPETPAKKSDEFSVLHGVEFDRIAIWTGDSVGPTFQLKPYDYSHLEVAMSQTTLQSRINVDEFLEHHGVKGMKWGVRRATSASSSSAPASSDSKLATAAQTKINSGGIHSVSNQELQQVISRMNLERQYSQLQTQHKSELDKGLETTKKLLKVGKTVEDVRKFLDTPSGKVLKTTLKGAFTAAKIAAAVKTGGASKAATVGAELAVRRAANHYTNVGR
jgi:2'-5' RNA ligase